MDSESSASSTVQSEVDESVPQMCFKCRRLPQEFQTDSCHHPCFCKACAMKCASGGRCLVCHTWYARLERIK